MFSGGLKISLTATWAYFILFRLNEIGMIVILMVTSNQTKIEWDSFILNCCRFSSLWRAIIIGFLHFVEDLYEAICIVCVCVCAKRNKRTHCEYLLLLVSVFIAFLMFDFKHFIFFLLFSLLFPHLCCCFCSFWHVRLPDASTWIHIDTHTHTYANISSCNFTVIDKQTSGNVIDTDFGILCRLSFIDKQYHRTKKNMSFCRFSATLRCQTWIWAKRTHNSIYTWLSISLSNFVRVFFLFGTRRNHRVCVCSEWLFLCIMFMWRQLYRFSCSRYFRYEYRSVLSHSISSTQSANDKWQALELQTTSSKSKNEKFDVHQRVILKHCERCVRVCWKFHRHICYANFWFPPLIRCLFM